MASTTPGGAIHGYLGAQSVEPGVAEEEDSASTRLPGFLAQLLVV